MPEFLAETTFSSPLPHDGMRLVGSVDRPFRTFRVLGISAFYHDSAAAIVVDGRVEAAVQEERFSRRKNDARFPEASIAYCLRQGGYSWKDIDLIAYYEEPILKADRLLSTLGSSVNEPWATNRRREARRDLLLEESIHDRTGYDGPLAFVQHHLSHASGAFYTSPFTEAACLVVDGVGEWSTTTLARADHEGVHIIEQVNYPHSLGLLYSSVTSFLGFEAACDEYKIMGLAAYGSPRYQADLERLLRPCSDGSFSLVDSLRWDFDTEHRQCHQKLTAVLGFEPRFKTSPITGVHADLAASVQRLTEEAVQRLMRRTYERCSVDSLVFAGGVALNSVANHRAFQDSGFSSMYIPPAPGDAGGAVGAALYAYHHIITQNDCASHDRGDRQVCPSTPFLGPAFTGEEAAAALRAENVAFRTLPTNEMLGRVSQLLNARTYRGLVPRAC